MCLCGRCLSCGQTLRGLLVKINTQLSVITPESQSTMSWKSLSLLISLWGIFLMTMIHSVLQSLWYVCISMYILYVHVCIIFLDPWHGVLLSQIWGAPTEIPQHCLRSKSSSAYHPLFSVYVRLVCDSGGSYLTGPQAAAQETHSINTGLSGPLCLHSDLQSPQCKHTQRRWLFIWEGQQRGCHSNWPVDQHLMRVTDQKICTTVSLSVN